MFLMFILNLYTCVDEFEGGGMAAQEADMMRDDSPSGDGAGGKPERNLGAISFLAARAGSCALGR